MNKSHITICCALIIAMGAGVVLAEEKSELHPLPSKITAPPKNPTTPAKVALGKQLFFDPRLSGDNKMSCATCHLPDRAWGDGLPRGKGAGGKTLSRNTQTLWNVGLYSSFFWDGRAASLEEQALGPIQSPVEMNQDLGKLIEELSAVPGYVSQFQQVFNSDIGKQEIGQALAAFQRTLIAPASPFDRYLAGDLAALSAEAKKGLELFRGEAGCIRCHHGPLLSDGKFYRLGVGRGDKGRGEVTEQRKDFYRFRTPTLRNVAQTGPYMHDGSLATLEDVVEYYYRGAPSHGPEGLELDISPLSDRSFSEMTALVEFLKSLSGKTAKITAPKLP